ncbi:MAG: redox-sensing transcriptional repressor Rex [Clostridium sp.]|nr:MAG: redox-sensing transcriptional repressor Rex [Clostridium sp.]
MAKKQGISEAVIKRLPRYYRYVKQLEHDGVKRVSSSELAKNLCVTASQVRQDFSNFGEFGQQGYGYSVGKLRSEIASILGLDQQHNIIIIGCGNIGKALARYVGFSDDGFYVRAMFDVDPTVIQKVPAGVEVLNVNKLAEYINTHPVDIAAICVQKGIRARSCRKTSCGSA